MSYEPYPWFGPVPCGNDSETEDIYGLQLTQPGESQWSGLGERDASSRGELDATFGGELDALCGRHYDVAS
jgi:hypothetical protein